MNLKIFTGSTMAEALARVRQELGSDAVILHTRAYRQGGFLGFGARTVIEITAASGRDIGQSRRRQAQGTRSARMVPGAAGPGAAAGGVGGVAASRAAAGQGGRRVAPEARHAPSPHPRADVASLSRTARSITQAAASAPAVASPAASDPRLAQPARPGHADHEAQPPMAGDLIRRTYAAARAQVEQEMAQAASADPVSPPVQAGAAVAVAPEAAIRTTGTAVIHEQLVSEMALVKQMVTRMMRDQRLRGGKRSARNTAELPGNLFDQYLALLQQEVADEVADEVLEKARQQLDPEHCQDEQRVRHALLSSIAGMIPTEAGNTHDGAVRRLEPAPDGRPRTIALIGPTGVGKTTTIAKLAATFKLKQRKHVGLITLDTYRIAAVEQLRTYADIIGIPLHVVSKAEELPSTLRKCAGCDVILIDTAGRSQRDDPKLEQLSRLIDLASPHEVHLVLSATSTQSVMFEAVERFSRVRADHLIFTKLDEAVCFGALLNVARKVEKRLSYVTTGQEVPHHIEQGQAQRLAELVLGGRLGRDHETLQAVSSGAHEARR